jgi:hypothetical protein
MNFERGIYTNLARWIGRRPDLGPPGTVAFPYVGLVRTTVWLWIGASALEMAVVHFIIPWPWVRWPLLIASLWGLVWMLGYLGGLIVHPHLVEPDRLRIRSGHTVEVVVPITAISSASTYTRSVETSRVVQLDAEDDQHVLITVSNQVNMHLVMTGTVTAQLPRGRYTFTQVSFWVDDPTTAVRGLRSLIPRT